MATTISKFDFFLVAGFFCGIATFLRGFRKYRKSLLLQGTPSVPVRSIAMGLVRIHGKAAGDQTVESPISHTPCCVYQVHIEKWIEKWKDEQDAGRWMHYGAETDGVSFHLEDGSGRVLVDPRGAELDIERTGNREVSSARNTDESDAELLAYVLRVGPGPEISGLQHNLEVERALFALKGAHRPTTPEELIQALGGSQIADVQQSFGKALEDEGPQSDPLREELRLAQIDLNKHPIWTREYAASVKHVTALQARVRKEEPMTLTQPLPPGPVPPPSSPTAEQIVASTEELPAATGRYRLTERCILPGHEYDITGTCAMNPLGNGTDDRSVIRKGTNEPTFLISGLARTDVDTMETTGSYLMIFGGAVLTMFCLGILLLRFGQF